jgi:hypothetical protein
MTTTWLGIHNDNHLLTSAQGAFIQQEHAERWARGEGRRRIYPVTLFPTHRHYKGGEYAFVGDGMHTETQEQLTAYINEKGLWFRPTTMFRGSVDENGYKPRFTLL